MRTAEFVGPRPEADARVCGIRLFSLLQVLGTNSGKTSVGVSSLFERFFSEQGREETDPPDVISSPLWMRAQ